ncbi:MAG TPA: DUF402 domain-containing protein [Trebonia sp.]
MDRVFIRKLKRPDRSAIWPAYRTAADRFGTWLFTPRGSLYRGEQAGVAAYCNVGSPVGPGIAVMHLVPRTGWWIATFWDLAEPRWSATVDICTPPRLADGVWTYTDLELDVLVDRGTGEAWIVDEDEFAVACDGGVIAPAEASAARQAADQITMFVRSGAEPFAGAGARRLDAAGQLGLAPVRHLP